MSQSVVAGDYFTLIDKFGKSAFVWHYDGKSARRVGVANAKQAPYSYVALLDGETLVNAMKRMMGPFFEAGGPVALTKMTLAPGHYYPRMARPNDQHPSESPGACPGIEELESELAISRGQLVSLMQRLIEICQVVHPDTTTLGAYGLEIRNLLILACTEVEAQWKAVLVANGHVQERLTTRDYVKLAPAMKLPEYAVAFPYYPWLQAVAPFADWTSERPTQSLPWYDDYNAVKHDRGGSFSRATLGSAMASVAACFIILCAQVGRQETQRWRSEFGYFFSLQRTPNWPFQDVYTYRYDELEQDVPVEYGFR